MSRVRYYFTTFLAVQYVIKDKQLTVNNSMTWKDNIKYARCPGNRSQVHHVRKPVTADSVTLINYSLSLSQFQYLCVKFTNCTIIRV